MDERDPEWYTLINFSDFDMYDGDRCASGQGLRNYGEQKGFDNGYSAAYEELVAEHGDYALDIRSYGFIGDEHTEAWKEIVAERLAADEKPRLRDTLNAPDVFTDAPAAERAVLDLANKVTDRFPNMTAREVLDVTQFILDNR
jgi:hypothetical protein